MFRTMRALVSPLVFAAIISLASPSRAQQPTPIPLAAAFARPEARRSDSAVLTPDGAWLAYEVFTPKDPRPLGEPPPGDGLHLFVVATAGGAARRIGPAGANCWRPAWSPDGKRLAFYSDAGGSARLWVHDRERAVDRCVSERTVKARHWRFDQAAWSPDGQTLYVPLVPETAMPQTPDSREPTSNTPPPATVTVHTTEAPANAPTDVGEDFAAMQSFLDAENGAALVAIDVKNGEVRTLVAADTTPRPSHLRVSPDGRWLAYASVFQLQTGGGLTTTYRLSLESTAGGSSRLIAADADTTERIYTGEQFAWTPDSARVVFTRNRRVWIADIGSDGNVESRAVQGSPEALADFPFALTANGRAVLVGASDADSPPAMPPQRLALVPLDGSPAMQLPSIGQPLQDGPARLWQPDPETLHLVTEDPRDGERSIVRITPTAREVVSEKHRPGRFTAIGSGNDGALIARFEGPSTPPDFFRVPRGFGDLAAITRIAPEVADVAIGPMRGFHTTVPTTDGKSVEVQSVAFLPATVSNGPLPTIVYLYAGARFSEFAQDFGGGAPNTIPVQIFATRGYAVLLVDVPLAPMGQGSNPVADAAAVVAPQVRHAVELGITDPGRVAVLGHSYGAYGAAGLLTASDMFRVAIAIDGVYDLPSAYGAMGPGGVTYSAEYFERGQGRMGTHPWAARDRYLANSPYHQADRIHGALLLLHGAADDTCPLHEAEKMFNACKRLGHVAELASYAGEGHSPSEWSLAHRVDAAKRMLAFLERHLAPGRDEPR